MTALNLFQKQNPKMKLSFTLPVATYGFTPIQLSILDKAVKHQIHDYTVNIMAMDYGAADLKGRSMGQGAKDAATGVKANLKSFLPSKK